MEAKLLVLCAMLAYTAAGPVRLMTERSDSCATTCTPSSKFKYQAGTTYTYDYTVQTETSMDGASEERAALSIIGQADIEIIDQCDHVLRMKNVRVHESNPSHGLGLMPSERGEELQRLLETSPLRFSFQDGVMAELCPTSEEDPWALNVKRGLLSALQNSMGQLQGTQSVIEADVTGNCPTTYEVTNRGYWGKTSIKRNKNLMGCTDRHGFSGSLQTATYQMMSEMQSVPLMTSEHECVQEVANGILQTSSCTEKHVFRPFSSEGSGAQTTVMQKLIYKSQQNGISSRKDWVQSRAEMTFDHGYTMKDSSEARARAEGLLATLCDMTMNGIQADVPRVFSQLVGAVKKMDKSDIRDIYRQLQKSQICSMNNERTKKLFMDAMPASGSSQAVDMMKDLIVRGDVTGLEVDLWMQTLAFIPDPTADMIDSVQELLQSDTLKLQAMLPVTTMVHNYCRKSGCSGNAAVDNIMQILEDIIGYRCSISDGNIKTALMTLKAIGNTGQSRAVNILNRCLGYRVPIEVRVAAADAFRRMPCDVDKSKLLSILRDASEESEIRISAYLQVMTCPTVDLLIRIQTILEDEAEESQVGAFIISHLSNLKETSCPLKQDIKQMVADLEMKKLFEQNPLKFSRNYEKSVFLQMVNSGLQAESNVIFSAESPMPRSASANITMNLFGHSINMLELGGRLEGVEYLLEVMQSSFFGDGKNKAAKKKLDELKGSGYARIFGNELAYSRFQGISSLTSGKTFNLLDFLIKLSKDHDYSFTQSLQFLDSSMIIPTAIGLPLTLSVNGTAVVDVKATGKMDLRKVSKTPRSVYVDGEIRPSGAINIDGVMSVDAMVTRTGLKVTGSLQSSLAMKGRVELDRGRILNVQVDMPDDKLDILDVRSKFFILHNKLENEQKMITDNRKNMEVCTGDFVSKVIGLELCGQVQFPNASMQSSGPYFPLTGPSSVSMVLHKRDSHTGYKLLAKRVENKRSSIAQLSFDTPGSSVVRAVSFDMMVNYPQKEAEVSFASPWKKTSLKGSLVNDAGMKSLTASVVIDDDQTYSLTSEVKVDDQRQNRLKVFTPMLELRRPGADSITLMGSVQMDVRGRSLSTDLTLNGATQKPLKVQASYTNTQAEKSVSGTISQGKKSYSAQAGVTYSIRSGRNVAVQVNPLIVVTWPKGDLFRLVGSTDFRQDKMLRSEISVTAPGTLDKPINFKCDVTKRSRKRGDKFNVDVRFKSKPFTGKVSGFINVADTTATKLTMTYDVFRVGRDRVTLNSKLSNKSTAAFRKYTLTSAVDFKNNPQWNVQTSVDVDHKKRRSGGQLEVKLGQDPKDKTKHILLSASVDRKIPDWSNVDVDYKMKAIVPMLGLETSMNGAHTHSPDSLASKATMKYAKGKSVKAEVNLKNKSDKQLRMNGDASLSFPGHSYEIDSSLKGTGRTRVHTLNVKTHNGALLAATSTYKASKDDNHDVTSDIRLEGFKPIKVSGSAGLQWRNLQLAGQVLHGKDTYSLNHLSKISNGPRGKWTMEVAYPSRVIAFTTIGGLQKNSADIDFELAWDKNVDDSAKVTVSLSGIHKSKGAVSSSNAKLEMSSPFPPLEQLTASVSHDNDRKRYGLDGKLTIGGKSNTYYSTLNALKPLSPSNLQISWSGGSPIPGYKRLGASVEHSADSKTLSTVLKASKGRSLTQVTVMGSDKSSGTSRDLSGEIGLKSEVRGWEDVTLTVTHKDDGLKYETSGAFNRNKDRYSAELDMTHSMRDWQMLNNGQLKLVSPDRDLTTSWQHRNSGDDVTTTLTSNWGRGKQLQVDIAGNKQMTGENKKVTGSVTVRSPWKPAREVIVTLNHEMSDSYCKHTAAFVLNGKKKASTELSYLIGDGDISGDFALTTPFTEDKSGSLTAKYETYPVTGQMELELAPRKKITGDLSFSKTSDTDMEGSLRMTTPWNDVRTVAMGGSTKREGEDMLVKANLDLGPRNDYDMEFRFRPDSLSLARVKINTPHSDFSALNTGYEISGNSNDFDAQADFVLKPAVGKYSALLNWRLDTDLASKLRITTPIRDLRYVQLTANSKDTPQGRKSRLELDYYPRQVYALTSFYTFDMPIVASLNVETPIQGYDSMGVSVRHQHSDTSINTHGQLQYLPDKTIEGTLGLNWARNVDGSLAVKTPFEKFEESKLSLRHDGGLYDFTSHAEAEFMKETMTADAELKSGISTSGSFSLESSLEDVEKVEASFNVRGDSDNFRSSASAAYGDQKMEGTLQHKFTLRVLKASATFSSPFTKNVKTSVDMSKRQGSMQATVSGQYGAKKVESRNTLQMDQPDLSASSTLSYTLDGRPQEMTATISKQGEWNNVQLDASFRAPFTEDTALSVKHTCNLPYSMENTVTGNYGRDYSVKSVNSFDSRDQGFSATSVSSYKLAGPMHEVTAGVSKNGDLSDMTVSATGKYDSQEVKVDGELKQENGQMAKLRIITPFEVFRGMSVDFTHFPSQTGFSQRCNVTYITDSKEENFMHSVDYSRDGMRSLQLDTSLISTFFPFESNFFKLRHNYDEYRKQCTGSATVDIYPGKYVVNYKRMGDWDQIALEASFDHDDSRILEGRFNRLPLTNGYKHALEIMRTRSGKQDQLTASMEYEKTEEKISGKVMGSLPTSSISLQGDASMVGLNTEINGKATLKTAQLSNTATVAMKKTGPMDDVTLEMQAALDETTTKATAQFKKVAGTVSGMVNLNLPIEGFSDVGGSFQHSGDLNRFNSGGSLTYKDGQEISGKATFYRYKWSRLEATAELNTPFPGMESSKAEYRHAGSSQSFTCSVSAEYGDSQKISADLRAAASPKYDMTLTVKTPFRQYRKLVAEAMMESLGNSHTASSSLDLGRNQRYAMEGSLDMDSTPMTASGKLTTPYDALSNVELSGSHQGQLDDFSSSFVFNAPQTDVVKGEVTWKYDAPLDLSGLASLNSELPGLEDLRLEMKTTDMGSVKTGHLMARWAPQEQVAMGGTYTAKDSWFNKAKEAEVTLITPFPSVKSATLHVQHEEKDNVYVPKMEVTLNGETLVDVESEIRTDNPSVTLTSRKPWPTHSTATLTRNGPQVDMEVSLNWDRDENDKFVRIEAKAKDAQDDNQRDLDYSLKVILPTRTMSSGMTLLKEDKKITSDGYMAWDDRANSKVFYNLELNDGSRSSRKSYDGTVKVGIPARTLVGSGSFSTARQTSAMDAAFSWDADRDPSKQVGFNAKVTNGEKTKADLTFRFPDIGKEVHIDHEMALNQGRTVWDGKTEFSYSPDSDKTLTLASSLKDVSDGFYSSGQNYSLEMTISHPHTDTDIHFTSHIGATENRYSAAMDTVYLTSRRRRMNMALRGEIDRLRRQMDLQLVSPLKKMSMNGRVESTEPYVIKLTNTFDDNEVIESQLNIDPEKRTMQFSTNYDLDHPDHQLVLKAGHVNASAIKAELYRQQDGSKITDAVLASRLVNPTLLHSRLAWRPQILTDLETYLEQKGTAAGEAAGEALTEMVSATGQELSDKYAAITKELQEELSPYLDLVQNELGRLGQQLERSRRMLVKVYRRNDFHMQDVGDHVLQAAEAMKEYNNAYREGYNKILTNMREKLDKMTSYNIREKYDILLATAGENMLLASARGAELMSKAIEELDNYMTQWQDSALEKWEEVSNHPHVQRVKERVQLLGQDYKWLMGHVADRVQKFSVPEQYASAIYSARDTISGGLSDVMDSNQVKKVKDLANEVYQQGAWAYNYWRVEENARKHLNHLAKMMLQLVKAKSQDLTRQATFLRQSNVTLWDPQQGQVVVDLVLPVPLKSLQEMPDLQAYLQQANNVMDHYRSNKATMMEIYEKYAPWASNKTSQKDSDVMSQLETYEPTARKRPMSFRNRRVRGM